VQQALAADGERTTRAASDTRLHQLVVAAELAACLVLLVGALLFSRTLLRLQAVDLGFDPEQVVSIEVRVPIHRLATPDRWQRLAADAGAALQRVRALPGATSAAATSDLPFTRGSTTSDVTPAGSAVTFPALYHRVSPGYFRTMGMTLVRGRDFTDADMSDLARLPDPRLASRRPGAVIVNETAARMFWSEDEALGRALSTSFDARPVSRRDVVGIVRDARSASIRETARAEVFVPYLEDPSFAMTLLVRSALPPDRIVPAIRRELQDVSGDFSTANVRTLDDVVSDSMRSPRFSAVVLSAFGAAAVLLSALGVFGVCAFAVAARRQEVGIRMALGATRADIARLFLGHAARPIAAGILCGVAGAIALGRWVASLLFGVAPTDPGSYAAAVLLLAAVAFGASYWPVRALLRADPAQSLRG
jgi:putative ABC transport system permease protein